MAQLPPKIPTMAPSWSSFSHHKPPSMASHPSWIDDFLDFSSARRSAHRRSASDSATFFEECRVPRGSDGHEFDRLDDEQLMSMFSDENAGNSNPSTPSDHDSANEATRPKGEAGEVESLCRIDSPGRQLPPPGSCSESSIDPKRVKRILANRQSAQRSRVRKLQYISELERSVTSLQTEVSTLSPRVAYLDHQRLILNVDNSALKQRIAALAQDKIFKDAHQEALKKELERLRQVYHQQNLNNIGDNIDGTNTVSIEASDQNQK